MFDLTESAIDAAALRARLLGNENCGAFNCFEGWVRRQNEGSRVEYLVYSAYRELALNAGNEVIAEAKRRFAIADAVCVHRYGRLEVGEMAVWVGVAAGHRDAGFAACRFIIDTFKAQVPIWKEEFYSGKSQSAWLANPESHGAP